jgi:hypothetical protein
MNRLGATSEWYTLAEALDELGVTHGIQIEAGLSGGTLPWRILDNSFSAIFGLFCY